jgi:hypothetical protein
LYTDFQLNHIYLTLKLSHSSFEWMTKSHVKKKCWDVERVKVKSVTVVPQDYKQLIHIFLHYEDRIHFSYIRSSKLYTCYIILSLLTQISQRLDIRRIFCSVSPAIFCFVSKLYRGSQFYWWRKQSPWRNLKTRPVTSHWQINFIT